MFISDKQIFVVIVTVTVTCLLFSSTALGYVGSAAQKAAARAAVTAAQRQAVKHAMPQTVKPAAQGATTRMPDQVVNRWTSSLCKPSKPCPLDEKTANTFRGGSYHEKKLGQDTVVYRNYHDPARKFGAPDERFSYWSRSNTNGTQAVIDKAIDVSRYGNKADRAIAVRVPKGTRIYEGSAHGLDKGAVGGGNQVILDRVKPEWELGR